MFLKIVSSKKLPRTVTTDPMVVIVNDGGAPIANAYLKVDAMVYNSNENGEINMADIPYNKLITIGKENFDEITFLATPVNCYFKGIKITLDDNDRGGNVNCDNTKNTYMGFARSFVNAGIGYKDGDDTNSDFSRVNWLLGSLYKAECFNMDSSGYSKIVFEHASQPQSGQLTLKVKRKNRNSETKINVYLDDHQKELSPK